MIMVFLLLPCMIYLSMRVVLIDPRLPAEKPSLFGLLVSICLGTLPVFLFWAPDSLLFNFLLALAISTIVSPILFSSMKTDDSVSWIKDKIFISVIRFVIATILIFPLTYFGTGWFIALASISIFSFLSWIPLWVSANGDVRTYAFSWLASCYVLSIYYVLVSESKVTPENWAKLLSFLQV